MGGSSTSARALSLVGAIEPFDSFYAREFPRMVDIAYAMSGSWMATGHPGRVRRVVTISS